jgi:chlorobactene glucosyltransferase
LIGASTGAFGLSALVGKAVELFLSCAWLAIMAWLILRAVRQRGLLPRLARAASPVAEAAPLTTVIVPARDEQANIGACLQALAAQDYPAGRVRVLIIDDHSGDDTAAIVRGFVARHPQISLIQAPPLPPRWVGKSHACLTGVRGVEPDCEWLCFIDADVKLAPGALSSAMQAALANRLDLLSLAPRQELRSFAERLILPCGLIILSFLQDLRQLQSRSGWDTTATGQFMLVRHDAYEAVGGHAAVCSAICEDLELARLLKRSGRSVLLIGGDDLLSTRMYTGWRTLWPGFAKNLVDTFGGPLRTLAVATAAFMLGWATFAIPVLDFAGWMHGVAAAAAALWLALAASGAAIGLHVAAALYFRIPFWYGLIFPLGYTAGALMAFDSVRRRLSGRIVWKGRIYS